MSTKKYSAEKILSKWHRESMLNGFCDTFSVEKGKITGRVLGEVVPCKWCGHPTLYTSTKFCNGCWELDHRINGIRELPLKVIKQIKKRIDKIIVSKEHE